MKLPRWRKPHPVPPAGGKWYAGSSEEVLGQGPFDTRQAAIDAAVEAQDFRATEDWRAEIHVGKYAHNHLDLSRQFEAEQWLETVWEADLGECGTDEDGDNHPLEELTPSDIADLEESVRLAIWHWQERKRLKLKAWWMSCEESGEWVKVDLDAADDEDA